MATKKRSVILEELRKTRECVDTLMRFMNIEIYVDGSLYIYDDMEDEVSQIVINGYYAIYPFDGENLREEVKRDEMIFDVYNNTKLMASMLAIYLNNKRWEIDLQKITNSRPDKLGHIEIQFANGNTWRSNVYKKDSLKYLDMIMRLEGAMPEDLDRLRTLDIDD